LNQKANVHMATSTTLKSIVNMQMLGSAHAVTKNKKQPNIYSLIAKMRLSGK
jgi:hypothetical protein